MLLIQLMTLLSQVAFADSFFYGLTTLPEGEAGKCEWRMLDPATKSERVLKKFSGGCPEFFFRDSGNGKFYYVEDQKLVTADMRDLSKGESWPLPKEATPPEGGRLYPARIWRDKTSNKVRFAFFDSDAGRVKTTRKADDNYSVTYKGKNIGETFALGIVGAAVSYEHDGATWKLVEARATNAEACDTVGLSVLKIEPTASTVSPHVDKSSLFLCSGDRDCLAKKVSPEIRKLIVAKFKETGIYFLNTAKGWGFVSPESAESEYSLPGLPALLYSPAVKKLIPLNGAPKSGQLALTLSPSRNWFSLQTDEPQKTRVYRYDDPKPQKIIDGIVDGTMWVEN